MGNSSLIVYTKLSPNCTKMTNKVNKKITIHHMAGNLSVETCANVFQGSRKASANYGIGSDGRIALYVNECDRAWTSSSTANDSQAVTIEVANNIKKNGGFVPGIRPGKPTTEYLEKVLEILSRNWFNTCYAKLAVQLGLEYSYVETYTENGNLYVRLDSLTMRIS